MNLKEEFDKLNEEIEDLEVEALSITHTIKGELKYKVKHSHLLLELAEVKSKIVKQGQIYVDVYHNVDFLQFNKLSVKLNNKSVNEAIQDQLKVISILENINLSTLSYEWFTQLEPNEVEEKVQVDFSNINTLMSEIDSSIDKKSIDNLILFIEMLTKSSKFAHKAHVELKKRM